MLSVSFMNTITPWSFSRTDTSSGLAILLIMVNRTLAELQRRFFEEFGEWAL